VRATRRALLATLVASAALLVPGLLGPTAAHAEEPAASVSITLRTFEPSLPSRDGTITVSGVVKNTSKKRIFRPRAYFWRNQAPITDNEGFDQALASASNDPIGARKIASFDDLFVTDDPYLAAGDSADFTLKVKVADLELSPTPGIYLMGVHVLQNEAPVAIGRARVFVPILSRTPPRNTLQLTTVVIMNSRPSLLRAAVSGQKAVFVDNHLAAEVAEGGRLTKLLDAADQNDVTFALDPELVEELQVMKAGYQVNGTDGDGPGQDDAGRWLADLSRMMSTHDGYRMLYGSLDVAALTHAGRQDIVQASVEASKAVALTAALPVLVCPGSGAADQETLATVDAVKPAAVLLSDRSTLATAPLLQGTAKTPIVSYTSTASGGGPGPEPSDTPVHLRQRLLAESWLQATTSPPGTTLGHVRVIRTEAQAEAETDSVQAPWMKHATLTQLLRSTPAVWDRQPHYTSSNHAKELDGAQLAGLGSLGKSWATWQDLLVDPSAAKASASAALARAASIKFRGADAALDAFLGPQLGDLDRKLGSIVISVTRRVTLITKSGVAFPITIRNTLPAPADPADLTFNAVRVKLAFGSTNSQRLNVQPIGLEAIGPGDSYQGQAMVQAKTNGTVRVVAQLYTDSGAPVGRPATIDVKATQAGTVGWLIAVAAGVVLVGTTSLRIRQVTRERARSAAAAESDQPVGGQPPPETGPLDATRSAPAVDTGSPPEQSQSIDV
jgi:hypothetical protein